ncbi:MAG: transcription antitermination factor NusB [Candidatus Dependentiae bacterium]|nr:transcription antitermination factor NusB [Candidatus Dependentiae bacterium]
MTDRAAAKEYPFPISCNELGQRDQRSLLFHLLYAADALDYTVSLASIAENIGREYGFIVLETDPLFINAMAIIARRDELDKEVAPLLANWRFERLSVATRLIVRYALWEMLSSDTSPSIVINEAVELAKCFAEQNAYRFVNGVLDEWAKRKGLVVPAATTTENPD